MANLGSLFIVATPIGNLEDITLRAIKTLEKVDFILCEDTRVSIKLLNHLGIKKKLISYNDANESNKLSSVIEDLKSGKDIALISDAGTPLISDPGFLLVKSCHENNIKVITIPGACSLIAALSICGLPTNNFTFIGFLEKTHKKKTDLLKKYLNYETTLVFFESPKRLLNTLKCIEEVFGNKQEITLAKELTKVYEEITTGIISNIINIYETKAILGEFIVLINIKKQTAIDYNKINLVIKNKIKEEKPSDLAKYLAKEYNINKNEAYKLIIKHRDLL